MTDRRHVYGSPLREAAEAKVLREQLEMRMEEVRALRETVAKRDVRIEFLESLLGLTKGEEVVPLHAVG